MKTFYQMSGEDTMKQLNGSAEPLTESQVKEHQEKYGRNELVEGKKKTVLQIFLEQYKDFLVIILIIAAIASGFMGDVESTAVILIVITMNAILGTVQTVKAEQSLASLKKLSGPEAKVLRNGTVIPIPSSEVTVGDIVMLDAGDYIPADGRLLESASLKVDESALTGESLGVEKSVDIIRKLCHIWKGIFCCNRNRDGDRSRKNRKSVKDNFREKDAASDQSGSVWSKVVDLDPCILWYFIRNQYFARR